MKPLVTAKRVLLYYSHAPAGTPRTSGSSSSPGFGDGGGVLRHELQDVLPLRLRKIVLEGEKIENLHPAAFKVSAVDKLFKNKPPVCCQLFFEKLVCSEII